MPDVILDGRGKGNAAGVTSDHRAMTDSITEPYASERSRLGTLYGVGTGSLSLGAVFDGPVLWFRNDDTDNDMFIHKLIFGWNGGTSSRNTTCFSLISYNTSVPTGAETEIDLQVENIKFASGSNPGTRSTKELAYKWDGSGSAGMTGSTGGFAQIPNRIDIGNTSLNIDGEIIWARAM